MPSDKESKPNVMDISVTPQEVADDNSPNQYQTLLTQLFFDGFHNPRINELEEYVKNYPVGYRFCPTDAELVEYYLKKKVSNQPLPADHVD